MTTRPFSLLCLLTVAPGSGVWGYTYEEVFQQTIPAAEVVRVSVVNVHGDISVQPWDRPEIYVEAEKRISGSDSAAVADYARKVNIEVAKNGEAVEIQTLMPDHQQKQDWIEALFSLDWLFESGRAVRVAYAISVPSRMDAELRTTNGRIDLGALEGRMRLQTTNGTLAAVGVTGEVEGKTTNGDIQVAQMAGGCDLETTNGKVQLEMFALGDRGCQVRVTNGSIQVDLPDSVQVDLEATTTNGSIVSDLPLVLQGAFDRRHVKGTLNGGGVPVALQTTNGSIHLRRK